MQVTVVIVSIAWLTWNSIELKFEFNFIFFSYCSLLKWNGHFECAFDTIIHEIHIIIVSVQAGSVKQFILATDSWLASSYQSFEITWIWIEKSPCEIEQNPNQISNFHFHVTYLLAVQLVFALFILIFLFGGWF